MLAGLRCLYWGVNSLKFIWLLILPLCPVENLKYIMKLASYKGRPCRKDFKILTLVKATFFAESNSSILSPWLDYLSDQELFSEIPGSASKIEIY